MLVEDIDDNGLLKRPKQEVQTSARSQVDKSAAKKNTIPETGTKLVDAKVKQSAVHERLHKIPIGSATNNEQQLSDSKT